MASFFRQGVRLGTGAREEFDEQWDLIQARYAWATDEVIERLDVSRFFVLAERAEAAHTTARRDLMRAAAFTAWQLGAGLGDDGKSPPFAEYLRRFGLDE